MNALEELYENPLTHRMLWTLGLGAGAVALGLGVWAMTRPRVTSNSNLVADVQAIVGLDQATLCQDGNSTVMQFQNDWNAANGSPSLTADGRYGPQSAAAAQSLNGSAPAACAAWGG